MTKPSMILTAVAATGALGAPTEKQQAVGDASERSVLEDAAAAKPALNVGERQLEFATVPTAVVPERVTYSGTSAKPLETIGANPTSPLAACQGDCDRDSDCEYGMFCFQRSGSEAVPGCSGSGTYGWDYCAAGTGLVSIGADPTGRLAECQGDCDRDEDCQEGLTCFQRDGYTAVPGCVGEGTSGWDYCVADGDANSCEGLYTQEQLDAATEAAKVGLFTQAELDAAKSDGGPCECQGTVKWDKIYNRWYAEAAKPLVSIGADPTTGRLLECQGDCDYDLDCEDGLFCFRRSGFAAVPGCGGLGTKDWDYCAHRDHQDREFSWLTRGAPNFCLPGRQDPCAESQSFVLCTLAVSIPGSPCPSPPRRLCLLSLQRRAPPQELWTPHTCSVSAPSTDLFDLPGPRYSPSSVLPRYSPSSVLSRSSMARSAS